MVQSSNQAPLRFGLVGCGRIAKRHAALLGSGEIAGAELAAVCDIARDRAGILGRKYAVPAYTDMDEMMCNEHIDVVTVLTESGRHAEHVWRWHAMAGTSSLRSQWRSRSTMPMP